MRYWLIVHDIQAFDEGQKNANDGSNTLGFQASTYNAKNIESGDMIVYYLKNAIALKGIYKVMLKPWHRVKGWVSDYQIDIKPVIPLDEPCDFREVLSSLEFFKDTEKWQLKIQGTNGIRELSETDFIKLQNFVAKYALLESGTAFPFLRPVARYREYNNASEELRDKEIYEYLFNKHTHRFLDKDILGLDPISSHGYQSMGILHHVGLWDEHKGFFKGAKILDAIASLEAQDKDLFKPVILSLMNFNKRLSENSSDVLNDDDLKNKVEELTGKMQNETIYDIDYSGKPKEKRNTVEDNSGSSRYPRDPRVAGKALEIAKHTCEFNMEHKTFVRKSNGMQYTEAHHFIPLSEHSNFNYSLDVEENICSLCSNCHNCLHYGSDEEKLKILIRLYKNRRVLLNNVKLDIDFKSLKKYYDIG